MKINDRLKMIGDLVKANSFCLDVGCDHALLDIYLVKKNKNIKAVASDIAEGPLNIAKNNIKRERLEGKIETRLGDGLDTYSDDIDTIIISGMGGRTMIGIMKNHLEVLENVETIILSPNNYQEDVKRFLCKNGFYISNERLVREKKYIYQIIVFDKGKKKYNKLDYFFGPVLRNNKDNLFVEYYTRELVSRKIMIKMLPQGYFFKKLKINKEIKNIENELSDVKLDKKS